MSTHARFSPSSAHRWMACPGSIQAEQGMPDTAGEHAAEGTAAHALAARCLSDGTGAAGHKGSTVFVPSQGEAILLPPGEGLPQGATGRAFLVDDDMAGHVQTYLDAVRDFAIDGEIMVEQRVDFSAFIGVERQFGTSDAVVITDAGAELQVHDLKYGRGVKVDAERNAQLMLYALGTLDLVAPLGVTPDRIRLVIHQPRLDHCSEWACTPTELAEFAEAAAQAAIEAQSPSPALAPSEKTCRWCKAKATCPAAAAAVQEAIGAEFEQLTSFDRAHTQAFVEKHEAKAPAEIAAAMAAVGFIEDWCKAIRAETERRLVQGVPVDGWKLVEGRRGSRKWADEKEAEEVLKAMRVKHDQMYDYSVISPTSAEKLAKAEVIGPRQWPKLQALITQAEGKPSVAPESDKRPALVVTPTADEFDAVPTTESATADDLV